MAEITREQVVDYLSNLPVIQIAELVKELENKWGVSAAPIAIAGAGPAAAAAPVEERRSSTSSRDAGAQKINVIKAARSRASSKAKDLVEGAPSRSRKASAGRSEIKKKLKARVQGRAQVKAGVGVATTRAARTVHRP
jgi:large subunit ribosomal protein L7/L12